MTAVKPTKNNNKCCNSRATSTIKVPLVINNNNKNKCNTNNNKSVSHKAQVRLQTEKIGPTPTIVLPLICCCCGFCCSYSYFRWCWCCVRCQQIAKGHNTIHKQTITQEYCFCGRRSFVPPGAYTSVCVCACVWVRTENRTISLMHIHTYVFSHVCIFMYARERRSAGESVSAMPWPAVGGRWAAEINYFSKQNMAKVGASKVVPLVVAAPSLSRAHSCLHLLLLLPALTWPKGYK